MDKVGFFGSIGRMWINIFNYQTKASKREYWFPVLFSAVIGGVAFLMFYLADILFSGDFACWLIGMIITAYLALSIIPFIALTVRRLHDTGRKGWWTFLLLAVGIGTLCIMLMCAGDSGRGVGVNFNPFSNVEVDVYGPPEWDGEEYDPDIKNIEDDYDPENNVIEDVYGPPEWFEEENDPEAENDPEQENDPEAENDPEQEYDPEAENDPEQEYDPEEDTPEVVYGPPEWFEEEFIPDGKEDEYKPDDNEVEDVYGPPEWFEEKFIPDGKEDEYKPDDNEVEDVYGPPEWFD